MLFIIFAVVFLSSEYTCISTVGFLHFYCSRTEWIQWKCCLHRVQCAWSLYHCLSGQHWPTTSQSRLRFGQSVTYFDVCSPLAASCTHQMKRIASRIGWRPRVIAGHLSASENTSAARFRHIHSAISFICIHLINKNFYFFLRSISCVVRCIFWTPRFFFPYELIHFFHLLSNSSPFHLHRRCLCGERNVQACARNKERKNTFPFFSPAEFLFSGTFASWFQIYFNDIVIEAMPTRAKSLHRTFIYLCISTFNSDQSESEKCTTLIVQIHSSILWMKPNGVVDRGGTTTQTNNPLLCAFSWHFNWTKLIFGKYCGEASALENLLHAVRCWDHKDFTVYQKI